MAKDSAVARVDRDDAPVPLKKKQRALLADALRRGEDVRRAVEATVTSYGRWLLSEVFEGDTSAALDGKSKNPVWSELVRRAGGPTLQISRRLLYVSVAIAALDQRITDQSWRGLDAARKELLLPLGEPTRLREAAQHVARFNLTQPKTRAYVTEMLQEVGKKRQIRLTAPRLVSRVKTLRASLEKAAVLRKVEELRADMSPQDRETVASEIERLREVLGEIARSVRGRRRE